MEYIGALEGSDVERETTRLRLQEAVGAVIREARPVSIISAEFDSLQELCGFGKTTHHERCDVKTKEGRDIE